MLKYILNGTVVLSLLGLSACTRAAVKPETLVAQCQAEVNPGGTYQYEEGTAIPVMTPVNDGTQAGADAFNACIRNKAASAGLISRPGTGVAGFCPEGAATIYGGATYCIGTN